MQEYWLIEQNVHYYIPQICYFENTGNSETDIYVCIYVMILNVQVYIYIN